MKINASNMIHVEDVTLKLSNFTMVLREKFADHLTKGDTTVSTSPAFPFDNEDFQKSIQAMAAAQAKMFAKTWKEISSSPKFTEMMKTYVENLPTPDLSSLYNPELQKRIAEQIASQMPLVDLSKLHLPPFETPDWNLLLGDDEDDEDGEDTKQSQG